MTAATPSPTPTLDGPALAAMRRARGLTMRRLGGLMGRTLERVSQIEDGRPLSPTVVGRYLAAIEAADAVRPVVARYEAVIDEAKRAMEAAWAAATIDQAPGATDAAAEPGT